jgi:hypothetical protein
MVMMIEAGWRLAKNDAVRLVICTGLQRWEMGIEVARRITPQNALAEREAAGQFHPAHAESQCAASDVQGAKNSIRALAFIWPEGRELALNSQLLAALW